MRRFDGLFHKNKKLRLAVLVYRDLPASSRRYLPLIHSSISTKRTCRLIDFLSQAQQKASMPRVEIILLLLLTIFIACWGGVKRELDGEASRRLTWCLGGSLICVPLAFSLV